MIQSFKTKETEKIWNGIRSAKFPPQTQDIARRKLRMLNNSVDLRDLSIPPANRLEKLKGGSGDVYSIRINDQWRTVFSWRDGHSYDVEVIDYH